MCDFNPVSQLVMNAAVKNLGEKLVSSTKENYICSPLRKEGVILQKIKH